MSLDHTFYSAASLKQDGRFLNVLALKYPETFRVFHHNLHIYPYETITGLFVLKVDGQATAIAALVGLSVDRLFVIPRFRGKGYAKILLGILASMSCACGVGIVSPILPELRTLYERTGWKCRSNTQNQDGTLAMITSLWKPNRTYDSVRWVNYLTRAGLLS